MQMKIFQLFSYNFIEGNSETALKEPLTVVITKSLSNKLFGSEVALGKTIKLNNNKSLTISAVIEEPNANSCLTFQLTCKYSNQKNCYGEWRWIYRMGMVRFQTFLLLKNSRKSWRNRKTILSIFPQENRKDYLNTKLTPLKSMYFSKFSLFGDNYLTSGDKRKVQILVLVASLILIIALINFLIFHQLNGREKLNR